MHTLKAIKSISYTCECTHGVRDVDCEFVMVAGVRGGHQCIEIHVLEVLVRMKCKNVYRESIVINSMSKRIVRGNA